MGSNDARARELSQRIEESRRRIEEIRARILEELGIDPEAADEDADEEREGER